MWIWHWFQKIKFVSKNILTKVPYFDHMVEIVKWNPFPYEKCWFWLWIKITFIKMGLISKIQFCNRLPYDLTKYLILKNVQLYLCLLFYRFIMQNSWVIGVWVTYHKITMVSVENFPKFYGACFLKIKPLWMLIDGLQFGKLITIFFIKAHLSVQTWIVLDPLWE